MNPIQEIYEDTEIIFKSSPRARKMMNACKLLAFDTETTGLAFGMPSYFYVSETCQVEVRNPTAFGISLCHEYKGKLKLYWGRAGTRMFADLSDCLQQQSRKIAHNARYDIRVLRLQDVNVRGPFDCTLIMSRIINDNRMKHSLQSLVEIMCPEMSDWEVETKNELRRVRGFWTRLRKKQGLEKIKDYANYSFIPEKVMRKYACIDVFMTYILYLKMKEEIQNVHQEVYTREIKIMHAALDVENRGLLFRRRRAKKEVTRLNRRCIRLLRSIARHLGPSVNPESYKQLLQGLLLFGFSLRELNHKGKSSTCADVLEKFAAGRRSKKTEVVSLILELRSIRMLSNRYLIPLITRASYNNGIVYCSINSADTKTGRMTISQPSLQNIPRPDSGFEESNAVRRCFGPRAGYTWYLFDYSQVEVVIFCLIAGAMHFVRAYMKGADLHNEMCKRIWGKITKPLRQRTKATTFGILYGMGLKALAEDLKMNITKADQIMSTYLERIPEIIAFRNECQDLVYQDGYVDCLFGKRYHAERTEAYKMVNKRIQGSCAQILKKGTLQVLASFKKKPMGAKLVLPIHDENIFERRNDHHITEAVFVKTVKDKMECIPALMKLGLRLRVDVKKTSTNWAEKENIECVS